MAADENYEEDEEVQMALAASMASVIDPSEPTSQEKDVVPTDEEEEMRSTKKPEYPPLPEEPMGDRNLLCRVGVRLPDGRRFQRNFLRTDSIQASSCKTICHFGSVYYPESVQFDTHMV